MNKEELLNYIDLDYDELCNQLKKKYGEITESYFLSPDCLRQNNKIKRGKEGLHIHHILEKGIDDIFVVNLAQPQIARLCPFEFQAGHNLCYCNILEHLLLHVKINIMRMKILNCPVYDGTVLLIETIEKLYYNCGRTNNNSRYLYEPIKENYSEFAKIVNLLHDAIKELNIDY